MGRLLSKLNNRELQKEFDCQHENCKHRFLRKTGLTNPRKVHLNLKSDGFLYIIESTVSVMKPRADKLLLTDHLCL